VITLRLKAMKPTLALLMILIAIGSHAQVKTIKMADGKLWMAENLNVKIDGSHCYDDKQSNCDQYGRLYNWELANKGCKLVGPGWHLPSEDEWRNMAHCYGGIIGDSKDDGKAAYGHLIKGGDGRLNIILGGGRDTDGSYKRIDAHGFYWTSTLTIDTTAWLYNFGNNSKIINHHNDMEKSREVLVRCIKD
jgi:uncharacterized protein (TIGR02145 family)